MLDLGAPVVRALVRALESIKFRPDRALQNLANTQKDSTATQRECELSTRRSQINAPRLTWPLVKSHTVRLGIRFFDFRPGYNFYDVIKPEKREIRHQHALVPGEEYAAFLREILDFLVRNPNEIVLVEVCWGSISCILHSERLRG